MTHVDIAHYGPNARGCSTLNFAPQRTRAANDPPTWGARLPHLDVFAQNARPGFSSKNAAEFIHGAELGAAAGCGARIAPLIENEISHPAVKSVADPDSLLESRIVHIVRLRVEDIDEVFVADGKRYTAWHSELVPSRQVFAFLIEDLYAGIGSIAHEQAASLVHGDAMRRPELTRRVSGLPPGFDEFPVLRVLHDAVVRAVAVRDENIPIGRRHHACRRAEMILIASCHSGFAERHQHRSVGTELADDVPCLHAGFGRGCHGVLRGSVRRPHIAVAVDMHPVWPDEHPGAKAFDHVAFRIELVDRIVRLELAVRIHAIEAEPAASRGGHRARLVASDKG